MSRSPARLETAQGCKIFVSIESGDLDFQGIHLAASNMIDRVGEDVLGNHLHDLHDLTFAKSGVADCRDIFRRNLAPGLCHITSKGRCCCAI
ncbi:hypothetical protein FHS96_005641 [Sphingomonas zeicaulis]|uniref:hypothetical protein n=1 Tax=Sphingomonas zeicaulis TaxID=1632740 RepID=UPI003D1BACC1